LPSKVRPARGRVYQEVHYAPAQAMQVDWGECGTIQVGTTRRKVSVFVAVLCHSRLMYIEFTLSQRKAEFYRGLVNALVFFGGSPRNLIFDNLKAAVLNGAGRSAFDGNRYSALPQFVRRPITLRANRDELRLLHEGRVVAQHVRSYERGQLLVLPEHLIDDIELEPADPALYDRF